MNNINKKVNEDANKIPITPNPLLRLCPSVKISNEMPRVVPNNDLPSKYFILNGQRKELDEFDLNWVASNCVVKEQVVY